MQNLSVCPDAKASPFGRGVTAGDGEGKPVAREPLYSDKLSLCQSEAIAVSVFSVSALALSVSLRSTALPKGEPFAEKGIEPMQLSDTERQRLTAILARYDQHPEVQRMREFIQHGDVTTYQHCKNVVLVSFWLNRRFHLGADETSLAVGAFLHDFYLYDWHKRSSFRGLRRLFEMHGFAHPGSACVNAERCFAITRKEQNIISSHMWPLTFRHVPTCREAVIVCLADKYCAVLESMFQRTRVADTNAGENEW